MVEFGSGVTAAGLIVGVVTLIVLHLLPTGLSPIRRPVSQYGLGRYRVGYRVQTISYGLAGLGAAIVVAAVPRPDPVAAGLCIVFALSRIAIGWFPMDLPGVTPTRVGRTHGLLAMLAFGSVLLAAGQLWRALDRAGSDHSLATLSGVLSGVMLLAILLMGADRRRGGGLFGLIERVFYLAMTVWFAIVAALGAVR